MQIIERMAYLHLGERQREQRLRFLCGYLDDERVGPNENINYPPRLRVGDLAARNLAYLLKVPAPQNEHEWGRRDWDWLRDRVREALAHWGHRSST